MNDRMNDPDSVPPNPRSFARSLAPSCAAALLVLCLGACGGEGLEGTPEARVEAANLTDLAVASASAVDTMSLAQSLPTPPVGLPVSPAAPDPLARAPGSMTALSADLAAEAFGAASENLEETNGDESLIIDCDPGSIEIDLSAGGNGTIYYGECEEAGVVMNGLIRISDTESSPFFFSTRITAEDFCITALAEGEEVAEDEMCIDGLVATVVCDIEGESSDCRFRFAYPGFDGFDGRVYSVSGISLDGNDEDGWMIDGRCTDPEHGFFEFETLESVLFECQNGAPSAGHVIVLGAEGSEGEVIFDDCSSFTTCIGEDCTSHDWVDFGLEPEPI